MIAQIYSRALTILATEGDGGVGGMSKTDILNNSAFDFPRLILRIMSIGFLFYAIFKIVAAIAKAQFPAAIMYVGAAALVLFLSWNPTALLALLDSVGSVFNSFFDLIGG